MRYLIIGLGIYGSNLAMDLTAAGHEVIGADVKPSLVENIKEYITTAYIIDSTDEAALNVLPLKNVDLVIVAIGENFGASVKTVALLKKAGVRHIFARAIDSLHESILEGLKVDRILTPEQRAAFDLTHEMALGHDAEVLRITTDNYVIKFSAPEYFYGMEYRRLNLQADFGLTLVAASRATPSRNMLGIQSTRNEILDLQADNEAAGFQVEPGDIFTCFGSAASYRALIRHLG